MTVPANPSVPYCPSARPGTEGSVVFGVRTAADGVRVGYLDQAVPVTDDVLAMASPADPLEVFRFGAPCQEGACAHFAEGRCSLVTRIVERVPVAVELAPVCALRSKCRWWQQEGIAACRRCPVILTRESGDNAEVAAAAVPEVLPPRVSA
jgi:hypothetical protein